MRSFVMIQIRINDAISLRSFSRGEGGGGGASVNFGQVCAAKGLKP